MVLKWLAGRFTISLNHSIYKRLNLSYSSDIGRDSKSLPLKRIGRLQSDLNGRLNLREFLVTDAGQRLKLPDVQVLGSCLGGQTKTALWRPELLTVAIKNNRILNP